MYRDFVSYTLHSELKAGTAEFSLGGHLDVAPKYINIKHDTARESDGSISPRTYFSVSFIPNAKGQGERNEAGIKRLVGLLRWLKANNVNYDVRAVALNEVTERQFLEFFEIKL